MAATLESALEMHRQGQLTQAGAMYQQVLAQDPKNLDAISMLSVLHEQSGNLPGAIQFAHQLIALKPKQIEYYLHLANLLLGKSETDEAMTWLEKAAKIDRRNLDVHLLLGDACQQKREFETALQHYRRALQLDRSVPDIYNNTANTYLALGNLNEAITHYQKAISLKKDYIEAYFNLGNAMRQYGNLAEAIVSYQKTIELNPRFYQGYTMLGLVAKQMGNYDHAEAFYRQAFELQPNDPTILANLAISLAEQDRIDEAMSVFDELAKRHPNRPDILSDFALIINEKGHLDRAMAIYKTLAEQYPANANHRMNHTLILPVVYEDPQDLQAWRNGYEQGLNDLLQQPLDVLHPDKLGALSSSSFYLAYQGRNDKALQQKKSELFRKILPELPPAPTHRTPNAKPKIGFISGHLSPKHTIGKLMTGILEKLSRDKFDVHIFSVPTKHAFSPSQKIHPDDHVHLLPYPSLSQSVQDLQSANLDILFYPDIGMDPFTYMLAHYRLAPVQCVTWGHPVTTGISSIDYFISSKHLELENAQDHYSENLVLLDSLPVHYHRPEIPEAGSARVDYGWTEQDHIYLCPQTLYKFHPDFDAILAGILRQDAQGKVILLARGNDPTATKLKARFEKTMPDVAERIQFLPHQKREQFLRLMACADVLLDPIHFGGGNTTYEALALGVPIVTWPSDYMRARVTAGCYNQMGMSSLIAGSAEEYIQLACSAASDKARQAQLRAEIRSKNATLFEDESVIGELEAFFQDALSRHQGAVAHD